VYYIQNPRHDGVRKRRWPFRKASDEFIEKFLGGYLKVKRVSARLDEGVEEGKS
jgi:hypothetical protein